jgi:lipopolysaccharide biosynthesis glycosyltransferase
MNTFCTVVTPSYLHFANALANSLSQSGNKEDLHVLLVDDGQHFLDFKALPSNIKLCFLSEISDNLPPNICFYFDSFELCNALKPFIVRYLFKQGFEKIIFLDSDIYVVNSFEPVWSEMVNSYLVLTVHHIKPPDLEITYVNESSFVDMGIFNGGFAGWRSGDVTMQMLDWMCTRFPIYGFCDRKNGMFVDQKLLPLLMQYFNQDIKISSNPSLNIAYWNCHERAVTVQNAIYLVEDKPVIFFHMSGFRLSSPSTPCSYLPNHENAAILSKAPWLALILEEYSKLLQTYSNNLYQFPRPFSKFNGIELTSNLRRILFRKGYLRYQDREVVVAIVTNFLRKIKQSLFTYHHE